MTTPNIDTAKAVLAKASLFDQSFAHPDIGIAVAWAEALGGIDYHDALAAVTTHYSQPGPRRIMPGDVLDGVRKIRAERIRVANSALLEPDDVDPNDVTAYLDAARARRRAIGSGQTVAERPVHPAPRPVEQLVHDTDAALPTMPPARPRTGAQPSLEAITAAGES